MFYSQFILAKKGPLGTIWIAAHLERKLRKNQVTETNISVSVDSILFPEVPIALRLSGHLLLGVVRIYSRKVNYLFHDCSEALVKIKQAFHAGAVDLPPEAATAPFHSITLPETFDLDEFEPLLDRELNLLHSNGGNDHHVSSREQITLQDPLEDNSYLGSQFELDERFPEADAPRLGLDFDEDLLDKSIRETSPALATLEEEEEEERALEEDVIPPATMDTTLNYDEMDRMDALDLDDDHQEPGTPGVNIDQMDLDYQHEVEGQELDQSHRSPGEMEQLEPDYRLDNDDELEGEKFEQVEGRDEGLEQLEGDQFEQMEEERFEQTEGENVEQREEERFEQLDGDKFEQLEGRDEEENRDLEFEADKPVEEEAAERDPEEQTLKRDIEREFFGGDVEEEVLNREVEVEFFGKDVEEETLNREAEQVTFEKQADEQEGVAEQHEGGEEQEQGLREGFEGEKEWAEKEEFQKEVPDYETVMSAPEPIDREPDVFDMDNDMRSEQVAAMDYQDRDVVMEDREEGDLVLEEEAVPSLHEEGPQVTMAEIASPGYPLLPAIGSDDLPGDDDVLASLLGRGTPALKVMQTPAETPAAKPRRKQNLKKRKILVDMYTILGADVMKQQLMNTDDIRRVRRKAPCTRQELWSVQKENLSHQIFNENSVPGLCGELRGLFAHVYVVGEAKLPLAKSPEPEVVASEEVPVPQRFPLVEDLSTTDLNIMAEQPAEVTVAEEAVQVPPDTHQQADQQEYQHADLQEYQEEYRPVDGEEPIALNVPGELSPRHDEVTHADDPRVPSPAYAAEEPAPTSPLKEAAYVVEGEAKPLDLNDEGFEYHPDLEYQAPLVAAEEDPIEEKEREQVEEEFNAPELVEPVADTEVVHHISETEIEGAIAPVAETLVEDTIAPIGETEVEGTVAPVVDAFGEPEPEPSREDEAVANVEVEFETGTGTQIIAEDEALIYDQGAVEPQEEVVQQVEFEEIKNQEEEPMAVIPEEHIDERITEPSAVEEVVITEEQLEEEELGFLADTRDTEFLGADDDDLVDEAEDFQDGKDYGRREQVQDNSGWSARTRAVGHYLRTTLEDKAAYMKKREEQGTARLGLERMLVGKTRKEAARMFFETLVLKTKDYIHVEQDAPYGDIQISARPKLLKAKF